jgi:hypothetical protein
MLQLKTMNFVPDIVKVLQISAALPSFAVMNITRMMTVMICRLRLPEMANDDAASVTDDERIGSASTSR